MSRSSGLAKASAVLAVAMLAASASNYLLNLALARLLSQRAFGDASLMVTWMLALTSVAVAFQLVTVASVAGRNQTEVAELRRHMVRRALTIGAAIALLLWAGADMLQTRLQTESAWPFRILGLGIPLYLGQAVDRGVVQARLGFGRLAASYLAEAAVRVLAGLSLVVAGFGVAGATWGLTLSFVASWSVCVPRRPEVRHRARPHQALERAAFGPMALLLGAQVIINNGDVLLSKLVFTPAEGGVYAAVALIGRAVFFVSWAAVQVVFPSVAGGDENSPLLVRRAAIAIAGLGAIATTAATMFGRPIADILFGDSYRAASSMLGPYAAATSLFAVVNLFVTADIGAGRTKTGWIMLTGAVAQTAVLGRFADTPSSMVWFQVAVMLVLVTVIIVERRTTDGARRLSIGPQGLSLAAERTALPS